MKKIYLIILIAVGLSACDILKQLELPSEIPSVLTETEIVAGLKEALQVGTTNAVSILSKEGGFNTDQLVRIPFPTEAQKVASTLRDFGLGGLVDDFENTLNMGAEEAVKLASPIFINALRQMSIADAVGILKGSEHAATDYFKQKTAAQLTEAFKPKVSATLDRVEVTKHWTNIMSKYNSIPFTQKIETDLAKYVTQKTMDGLFLKLAEEESQIRKDPAKRVTAILKKVFDPNALTY